MVDMTEEEKLALEQAAKQEGREDAQQDAAIAEATETAAEAEAEAGLANDRIDGAYARINGLERRLNEFAGAVTGQLAAMGEAIEALAVAEVVETVTNQDEHEEIKQDIKNEGGEQEIPPPPAKEPERRKRGWA